MIIRKEEISYKDIPCPQIGDEILPVDLTDETMKHRKSLLLDKMKEREYDVLVIYGDREHGHNFSYLTGFEPRFEEALLVIHKNGEAFLLMGNESAKMVQFSRINASGIAVPYFSLPNQPMNNDEGLRAVFEKANICEGMKVGIIGWKMFTSEVEDNKRLFDVPHFMVEAIANIVGENAKVENATDVMIHPQSGIRTQVNTNEIAHYEFGATLASRGMLDLMNQIEVGKTEMELADKLALLGQPTTVTTICATGERFTNATVFPRNKKVKVGDRFSATVGFRGGLSNRVGYAAENEGDLGSENDFLESMSKPYFAAACTWYSSIEIGVSCGKIYDLIEEVIPKKEYGWHLNPGHYVATEEWMSSPFYEGSEIKIKDGSMFQMDIIISKSDVGGANAEDGIAVAGKELREDIAEKYPEVWKRIEKRREYMKDVLGIELKPEVLPLSDIAGYYRPFFLCKNKALVVK